MNEVAKSEKQKEESIKKTYNLLIYLKMRQISKQQISSNTVFCTLLARQYRISSHSAVQKKKTRPLTNL